MDKTPNKRIGATSVPLRGALFSLGVLAGCGGPAEDGLDTVSQAANGDLAPLSTVPVPQPTGGDIRDQAAAVRLGKAFFWDIQTGGDGQTACATCHFQGGADNRRLNTLSS